MFILIIILICPAFPALVWAEAGTAENPYAIAHAEDLAGLAEMVSDGSSCAGIYFSLAGDIDLGDLEGRQWTPIGSPANPFCGVFDGSGYTISGLVIDTGSMYQGLFGYLGQGAVVRNLTIENSEIRGGNFTGTCAGGAEEGSLIQNVVSYADVIGGSNVGGIVGMSLGTIEGSRNHGTVSGQSSVGGIAGLGSVLKEAENTGAVSAYAHMAGGIAGELHGSVKDSRNTGTVAVGSFYGGGIVGATAVLRTEIERSYNRGSISGSSYMGGIVGMAEYMTLISCFNDGEISGSYGTGGIAGVSSRSGIQNCYDTGSVNGKEGAGGIAGRVLVQGSLVSCYSIGEISGTAAVGNIAGSAVGASVQISSSFYLEGSGLPAVGEGSGTADALSSAELKQSSTRLGDAYMPDDPEHPVNKGYPILKGIDYGTQPGPGPGPEPGEGSGTEEDPYILDSADDLGFLAEEPDAYFKMNADIDLEDGDWEPIELFTGVLDGNGNEIKNLTLDSGGDGCGLFRQVDGAVIKNITISGGAVSGKMRAGILAGSVENTVIENCIITGSVSSGEEAVGGLAGEAYNSVIRNVTVSADVEGDYLVGGLAGYAANCEMESIVITGQVSGRNGSTAAEIGGVLGMKTGGTLEKSGVTGKVSGPGSTGGLIGVDLSGQGGWVKNCFVLGDVAGEGTGGLIGEILTAGGVVNISNCYFAGTLTDRLGAYNNVIPEGSVSCYFDGTKNPGTAALQQKYARSTQQLQVRSTYQDWDFVTVWMIVENQSYPQLRQ